MKCVLLAVVSVFLAGVFVLPAETVEDCGRCRDPPQNETVCENDGSVNIQCPAGKVIEILYANFGRTRPSSEVCPYRRNHQDRTDCIDANSLDVLNEECDGEQSCSVQASNSVFGDPCFGTYKYLEVQFSCVRRPCPQVSCTPLPTYTNGDWNDTRCDSINFQCPLVCQLSCDEGYYISDGVGLVACDASGSYEPNTVPECLSAECPEPSSIDNGDWTCPDSCSFQYPQQCTFACNSNGYEIVPDGAQTNVTCQADGTTDLTDPPSCQGVQCPVPGGVTNGAWSCLAEFRFPDECTFACNDGYELVSDGGQTTVNCQADSMNDLTNPPNCQEVECPEPPTIANGQWTCTDPCEFRYLEQCTFECDNGYELVPDGGQTTVSCGANGTNDLASIPSCRGVECPVPGNVTNGAWSCPDEFRFPEDCTFECDSGYELISGGGQTTVNCQADAMHDLTSYPSCQGVLCPSPSIVYNGTWTCDNAEFRYPDTCILMCDTGYEPDLSCGQTSVNCLEDATIDLSDAPSCRGVLCPALTNLLIGRWEPPECYGEFRYPLTCTLDCPDGYTPSESIGQVACLDDKSYDSAEPNCVPVVDSCDLVLTDDEGSFTSLEYPSNYPNDANCTYLIDVTDWKRIILEFPVFHLEQNTVCDFDRVTVYDGDSRSSPVLGTYCGDVLPTVPTSTGDKLLVELTSDFIDTHQGFRAEYRSINLGSNSTEALIDGATYNIPDSSFSATNTVNGSEPWTSRLNKCLPVGKTNECGWKGGAIGNTITVDLGQVFRVDAVATQGTVNSGGFAPTRKYVTSYKLAYSNDGVTFTDFNDGENFTGNSDGNRVIARTIPDPVAARYIRLEIVSFQSEAILRWELYGFPASL